MRVTLSIIPFGDEESAYEIGRLDIFNKGSVGPEALGLGLYQYGVINLTPKEEGLYQDSIIHSRYKGAWELTRKALNELDITGP